MQVGLLLHHLDDDDVRQVQTEHWQTEFANLCGRYGLDQRPYGKLLTPAGWDALARVMPEALSLHTDDWLAEQMSDLSYWKPTYMRRNRSGTYSDVNYNKPDAIRRLALTEFNTAYVQAVAMVGLQRGFTTGELYRAGDAAERRARCVDMEGQQVPLRGLLDDFRCYFPGPSSPTALPVPAGPNCHHSVRLG